MTDIKLKPLTSGWILVIIYVAGIIGLIVPQTRPLVQKLIGVTLFLTFFILFCYHKKWTKEFIFSAILVALIGFLIDVLGVKTGYIFGYYQYGPTLGYSFWDTPLLMMVYWLTIIYITRQIAEMIAGDAFVTSILAGLLIVLLDYFAEPFAIRYSLWKWNMGEASLHNYIGVFICGIIIQYIFRMAIKYPPNKLALPVYLIQLGFFMVLFFLNK